MPDSPKIRILLADQDALRRDGLAAVLSGGENFEIIGDAADGESALDQIRRGRPDVAIVDLNLPKLHGIELVRRIRSEALGTRVVILAGTTDEEVIREVIRAGGDGYLLRNGPARHVIDAIFYVQDGGQYFSPQLRRDGRDRHLLEEPLPLKERRGQRRGGDPAYFRERRRARLREEANSANLNDRDYEIMTRMADGIRPILDRLDEIDGRVAQMEAGDEPIPANPRGWLSKQLAETLHDEKPVRSVTDLESRLPEMIERAVAERFQQMAGRLQQEIEEAHVRTLETFVKNIQVKLLQRVSALEQDMAKQADSMHQLRECSQRTEDNLSRLITGVDKLAQELPKRLQAPGAENVPSKAELAVGARANAEPRRSASNHTGVKVFWLAVAGVVMVGLVAWGSARIGHRDRTVPPAADEATSAPALPETGKPGPPPSNADTKTRLQAAEQYTGRKDYAMAEDIYKQIIRTEPDNVDALKALASVLYREDKIDESAAILDRIPK